jgi:hypothetical protein
VILWFFGSQQLRFLLPIYPLLATLAACAMVALIRRSKALSSLDLFLVWLPIALIFIPIFYQAQILREYRTVDVLVGRITRETFLEQAVGDYSASRFIQDSLPDSARVLMLGNGRGYYCAPKCLPDPDHFHHAREINDLEPPMNINAWLRMKGATHFLISIEDLDFLLQHDPLGAMNKAVTKVINVTEGTCFSEIFRDDWVVIFEAKCLEE